VIGIITNPNALGLVRDKRLARRLADIVGPEGVVYETRTPEELRDAVRELHDRRVDVLATCGGDGTNLSTLTEIVRTWRGLPSASVLAQAERGDDHPSGDGAPADWPSPGTWSAPDAAAIADDNWPAEPVDPLRVGQSPPLRSPNAPTGQVPPAHHPADGLPQFAILRGGTVNTVANNLGVRGHPEEILARLVSRYRNRGSVPRVGVDLLEVNGRYGFLFGAAMPGRFFEAYYGGPATGVAWAGALAARAAASGLLRGSFARWMFEPLEIAIAVDGEAIAARAFTLVVAATVQNVGIGVRITYRAGTQPGRFHLIASSLPPSRLIGQAARVFTGRPLRGTPHTDTLAARASLRFAAPQTYTLDGDLFRADRVALACGPRIDILTP